MELKVYYKMPGGIDEDLDRAIEKAVLPFGLRRWASGISLLDGGRDLAFEKMGSISPRQPDSG